MLRFDLLAFCIFDPVSCFCSFLNTMPSLLQHSTKKVCKRVCKMSLLVSPGVPFLKPNPGDRPHTYSYLLILLLSILSDYKTKPVIFQFVTDFNIEALLLRNPSPFISRSTKSLDELKFNLTTVSRHKNQKTMIIYKKHEGLH